MTDDDDFHLNPINFDKATEQSTKKKKKIESMFFQLKNSFTVLSLSSSGNVHDNDRSEPFSAVTRFGCTRQSARKKEDLNQIDIWNSFISR